MKTLTFDVYSDPGHGWLKVKKSLLTKLGIAQEVSGFSYERGDFAYLEEDCDAALLINALKAKGIEYKFKESWTNKRSRIRNYARYEKPTIALDASQQT